MLLAIEYQEVVSERNFAYIMYYMLSQADVLAIEYQEVVSERNFAYIKSIRIEAKKNK